MDPWKNKQRNVYESLNNPENFTPEQIQQQQNAALWAAAQSKIQQQNFSEFYQNCPPPHPFSTEPPPQPTSQPATINKGVEQTTSHQYASPLTSSNFQSISGYQNFDSSDVNPTSSSQNRSQNWMQGNQRGSRGGNNQRYQQTNRSNRPQENFYDDPIVGDMFQNQGIVDGGQYKNSRSNWNQSRNQGFSLGSHPQHQQPQYLPSSSQTRPRFQQNPVSNQAPQASPQNLISTPDIAKVCTTSQEEIEFDQQFRKWQQQFDNWKQANANHPDRDAYRAYEQTFEECRRKLLARREEMKKKKLEQKRFESQWKAGDPTHQDEKSTPASLSIPFEFDRMPSFHKGSFKENRLFEDPINEPGHRHSTETVIRQEQELDLSPFKSLLYEPEYHHSTAAVSHATAIPGLDYDKEIPLLEKKQDASIIINLTEELAAPPTPSFNSIFKRHIIDIRDILNHPGRNQRYNKICIFIRGPPGSGKSYLAERIQKNEREFGNNQCKVMSIHNFHTGPLSPSQIDKLNEELFYELRNIFREGKHNLVIVEINVSKILFMKKCAHIATSTGAYQVYVIEIHQSLDTCEKYCKSVYTRAEISNSIDDFERSPTPGNYTILDATGLLKPDYVMPPSSPTSKIASLVPEISTAQSTETEKIFQNFSQLLQDKNIMELVQKNIDQIESEPSASTSQNIQPSETSTSIMLTYQTPQGPPPQSVNQQSMNFDANLSSRINLSFAHRKVEQPQWGSSSNQFNYNESNQLNEFKELPMNFPTHGNNHNHFGTDLSMPPPRVQMQETEVESSFDEVPTFTPARIIDYKHKHMPTFEEHLMEFKIFRTIEYNHRPLITLNNFIRDVDIDKIVEKRRSVAMRKKILEYLKNAERPEETVSNPKYPNCWEVIIKERPPRKNRRSKKKTPKILRLLAQKENSKSAWMTKGYKEHEMELEEISSDDGEMQVDIPVIEAAVSAGNKILEPYNRFYSSSNTIPDFNHFNHQNVMDIKGLLWKPDRDRRPSKIMIILRGAPGSGKSHLAKMIRQKEKDESGDAKILAIDNYISSDNDEVQSSGDESQYESQMMQNHMEEMLKSLKRRIDENLDNFFIVVAEFAELSFYCRFYSVGKQNGFGVYTIELYQTFDICEQQNIHHRSQSDILDCISKIDKIRIPSDHMLLIPIALYIEYKCLINNKIVSDITKAYDPVKQVDDVVSGPQPDQEKLQSYKNYLVQTIDDDKLPEFNWHSHKNIRNIREILDEPGRSKRSPKIEIILRGPSGSGKSYLASKIYSRELAMGNESGTIILSIDDYFINPITKNYEFNFKLYDDHMRKMVKNLRDIIRGRLHNFIIIDAENTDKYYEEFCEIGNSFGQCYTIELFQDVKICLKNTIHNRTEKDIEDALEEMQLNPADESHTLLDPTDLYVVATKEPSKTVPLKSALKSGKIPTSPEKYIGTSPSSSKSLVKSPFSTPAIQKSSVRETDQVQANKEQPSKLPEFNWYNREITDIRELLEAPGRANRPSKIMIILRGVPGSGKSYLASLIERKEVEKGNHDQFKLVTIDEPMTEKYMESLGSLKFLAKEANSKFIVVDADCCDMSLYNQIYDIGQNNGYACYTIELNQDDEICLKYNIHQRDPNEIKHKNIIMRETPIPQSHALLDPEYLYKEYHYTIDDEDTAVVSREYEKLAVSDTENDETDSDTEMETIFGPCKNVFGPLKSLSTKSKWDDDETPDTIERMDGTKNKIIKRMTMADYLQTDDDWTMRPSTSDKKRVRWADIEEKKAQERMREVGFIVGHNDYWNRIMDTSDGRNALEKTKFIEPRQKRYNN